MLNKKIAGAVVALSIALGSAAVSSAPAAAAPAPVAPRIVAHDCYAKAIYGNGPGKGINQKHYRAWDEWCDGNGNPGEWWGDWRLKKSSAQADAKRHNSLFD